MSIISLPCPFCGSTSFPQTNANCPICQLQDDTLPTVVIDEPQLAPWRDPEDLPSNIHPMMQEWNP